jgi:hypothetical protein
MDDTYHVCRCGVINSIVRQTSGKSGVVPSGDKRACTAAFPDRQLVLKEIN